MRAEVAWSAQARQDLLDIYVLIGLDEPAAAERYYTLIESKADLLAEQPRLGVRRRDIRPSTRMLVVSPYLILYQTWPDADEGTVGRVDIVRVVDGRRDLAQLFPRR